MHSAKFPNPYAIEVVHLKKKDLIEGISKTEHLLNLLIDKGVLPPETKVLMSFYRTKEERNSKFLDVLVSQGERACRLFFYPCLKLVEPDLYQSIRTYGRTALHSSAEMGHVSATKELLRMGADIYATDKHSDMPINLAAHNRHHSIIKSIAEEEIRHHKNQRTFLHIAAIKNNYSLAKVLLQSGSPVDVKDNQRKTSLFHAVNHRSENTARVLLEAGADANAVNKEKKTPLHLAVIGGHAEVASTLLASKASVKAKDMDGCTPLHYAAANGHLDVTAVLLSAEKKNVNDKNVWRKTPLHLASEHGHDSLIDLLLSNSADINALDNNKDTPLHCASRFGHLEFVQRLLSWTGGNGAKLHAKNNVNKTPLQVAQSQNTQNHQHIASLLQKKMLLIK
ncbi:ankyrin-3-like [Arapaima gigas]